MPVGVLPRENVGLLPRRIGAVLRSVPGGLRRKPIPMIRGRRSSFEARCIERGYTLDEVAACIVSEDGDIITVDETHPAYPKAKPLSLAQKAANFAKSAAKHVAAGSPQCTDEQIAARFAICQGCEFLKNGSCEKCGCPIARAKKYISKIAWADQGCPVGKWGPVV